MVRQGSVWRGLAWCGLARQGKARKQDSSEGGDWNVEIGGPAGCG